MALPLTLPLRGSRLIEASAGTGKTFTIALLYVRLVLGHGAPADDSQPGENGYHRPLLPPEILVVTFTEAATQELRMRIRERLVEAAEAFRQAPEQADPNDPDPLLALRNAYTPARWSACARRLQVAAEWMDESAVSTIHGWAYRMLREHAFDSGNLFRQELVTDRTALERDAINDYWRRRFYPLDERRADRVHACFASPDTLHRALKQPLMRDDAVLMYGGEPLEPGDLDAHLDMLINARAACEQAEARARSSFGSDTDTLRSLLDGLRKGINKATFSRFTRDTDFARCLEELGTWARGGPDTPYFVAKVLDKGLRLNKGHQRPDHPFFDELDTWRDALEELAGGERQLRALILADARNWVRQRLDQQLTERSELGFTELLKRLDAALHGPKGDILAARIRRQFPAAMIDEFQDTDPVQYRLFDRVYRVGDNDQSCCLVLIGDPKQAIYGFRGADIHTYLKARRATAGRHHTLDRNFRSTRSMVEAVNHLFRQAEGFPRAAFRFQDHNAGDNPVPFTPVHAKGRDETLVLNGAPPAALTVWLDRSDDSVGTTRFRQRMAEQAAEQITSWLNQAQHGLTGFHGQHGFRPLRPGDVAVLVRDRKEAAEIRAAMERRGLSSVYLSDRDSVFETPEAEDVLAWLRACARPEDDSLLRAALATRSLDQALEDLDRLHEDELFWESRQERFYDYHKRWVSQGVLPMLRRLLHDFHVAGRLLARADGERRMTNLLHLAEWAQQAGDTLDGPQALVRVLTEHIQDPPPEEQVLRLESDAELIQVVTIHKSKGLEYPLVVLPFACSWREISGKDRQALYHRDGIRLEIGDDRSAIQEADDERLSEDVRLLYVALTRACHATWLGLAPLAPGKKQEHQRGAVKLHKGALGYLLAGGSEISDAAALTQRLDALRRSCPHIGVQDLPPVVDASSHRPAAAPQNFQPALKPSHRRFQPWWVASYSSLDTQAADGQEPETAREATRSEETEPDTLVPVPDSSAPKALPSEGTIHAFPRGPGPGTFLHGLLEWAGAQGFAQAPESPEWADHLQRWCANRQWPDQVPVLDAWLRAMLQCPLTASDTGRPMRLSALAHYRVEQEFWFAVRRSGTADLDALLRRHILPGQPRPALKPDTLNGLLKGFIDLVAEHDGRYYVIDWKSNYLGPDDSHYTTSAMEQALLEKRYDLQLALYLLALHRHLGQRLGRAYDYGTHVGGALYVFLRGVRAAGHGVLRAHPPRAFIQELDALLGAGVDREVF
ncbi:MAG: exodeoxyribonuclease V subunit beta [Ectothiorhodospiraceae bacterium]|nr:exodeoxyribonuclease V subunit beta [Ectothiorhodospiraceae bacterium]